MLKKLTCLSLVLFFCISFSFAKEINIVTSFSILENLIQSIGGNKVTVHSLSKEDEDHHAYQLKPSDLKKINAAELIILNGFGFESQQLIQYLKNKKKIIVYATKGITPLKPDHSHNHDEHGHDHHHDINDPHAWQNPKLVQIYAKNIATALITKDPKNTEYYLSHFKNYYKELIELDLWAENKLKFISKNKIKVITNHASFNYLGERFGIDFIGVNTTDEHSEISAKKLAGIINIIKIKKIKAIFSENINNMSYLNQISKETGVLIGPKLYSDALSSSKGPASTYINMMKYNINTLVNTLK